MLAREGKVIIHKGFMEYDELKAALDVLDITKDDSAVIHFRRATSGSEDATATHPFPVVGDPEGLRALYYECKYGFAHNGILPLEHETLSDSQVFVQKVLMPLYRRLHDKRILNIIAMALSDSRGCILSDHGVIHLLGEGWIDEKGIYYSNNSFREWLNYIGNGGSNWNEEWYNAQCDREWDKTSWDKTDYDTKSSHKDMYKLCDKCKSWHWGEVECFCDREDGRKDKR